MNTIGIDIGGTKIFAILFDGKKIVNSAKIPTLKNKKDFIKALEKAVISAAGGAKIGKIGVGIAGALDLKKGKVLRSPNIPWIDGLNIRSILEKLFKVPVKIDNDSRCFARAEHRLGAGKGTKNMVGLILGTGVGSGVIVNNEMYSGATDSAGEVGHTVIAGGKTFGSLASFKFIKKHSFKTVQELIFAAKNKNKKAEKLLNEYCRNLGVGLANIVNVLNPEIIVVGGGIAEGGGKYFLRLAKKEMAKLVLSPRAKKTKIVVSKLGGASGAIGAALLR